MLKENSFQIFYLKMPRKLHPSYALGGDELAIYFDFQYIFKYCSYCFLISLEDRVFNVLTNLDN
jgi:hypothetical protein